MQQSVYVTDTKIHTCTPDCAFGVAAGSGADCYGGAVLFQSLLFQTGTGSQAVWLEKQRQVDKAQCLLFKQYHRLDSVMSDPFMSNKTVLRMNYPDFRWVIFQTNMLHLT